MCCLRLGWPVASVFSFSPLLTSGPLRPSSLPSSQTSHFNQPCANLGMQEPDQVNYSEIVGNLVELSSSFGSSASSASMMSTSPIPESAPITSTLVNSIQELDRVAQTMLPKLNVVEFDTLEYIQHCVDTAQSYYDQDDLERTYLYMSLSYRMSILSNTFVSFRADCLAKLKELRSALVPIYNTPDACRWWLSFDPHLKVDKEAMKTRHISAAYSFRSTKDRRYRSPRN